jgi:hypothetical protein
VLVHASHECEEIGDIYFNDEVVPLDGSGNATGRYAGFVRIKKHLGTDSQTVDTDLQTDVTSGVWSNDHRLRGIAYTYVRLTHSPDLFPSGIPNVTAIIKGRKVYDPRSSTTAYSANAALCLRDYLLLAQDRGGFGADSAEVDDTAVQTAANICDESVNLNPSGTESRYTANGMIDTAIEPGVVISGLCSAMAGICPYVGGKFKMKAGAHTSSVLTLTEDNVRGKVGFATRDSLRSAFNGVKGTYVSSLTDYQPADFPANFKIVTAPNITAGAQCTILSVGTTDFTLIGAASNTVGVTFTASGAGTGTGTVDPYLGEDGGQRLWRDLGLGFTTSSSMAQRLAKIELERSRQDITITLRTSMMAIEAHVGDVVAVTLARYGWSAKLFEVVDCKLYVEGDENPVLGLEWTLRETASAIWDWANTEETTVDLAPNTTLVDPYTVPTPSGLTLSDDNFSQPNGSFTPRLKVVWTAPANVAVTSGGFVEIEYKKDADSTWLIWNPALRGDATEDYILDVEAAVAYDVRIRFRNNKGVRGSYASATHTVADDSEPLGGGLLGQTSGGGSVTSTSFVDLLSLTVTTTAAPLNLLATFSQLTCSAGSSADQAPVLRFLEDGVQVGSDQTMPTIVIGTFITPSLQQSVTPASAGSHTYKIQMKGSTGSPVLPWQASLTAQ